MEMFLMAAVMSLMAVAVCAVLFAAATRQERADEPRPALAAAREPQRFFASGAAAPQAETAVRDVEPDLVPVDALLLRIEQHIRLEQAAAESFLNHPTGESLHRRTTSRLVN